MTRLRYAIVGTTTAAAILFAIYGLVAATKVRRNEPKEVLVYRDLVALSDPSTTIEDLPNVLLIGDSISIGYTAATREILAGIANVYRIPENGGTTTNGLVRLEEWLEGRSWVVIHVNFGLHDLFREKRGYLPWSPRAPRVQLASYDINLRTIIRRLKATGAKVIVATTTPVPSGAHHRDAGSEILYNATTKGVAVQEGAALNDLHAKALAIAGRAQFPNDVHFTAEGYDALAAQVATAICQQLQNASRDRSDCRGVILGQTGLPAKSR